MREVTANELRIGAGWRRADGETRGWFVIHRGDEILLTGHTPTTHADEYEASDAALEFGTSLARRLAFDLHDETAFSNALSRLRAQFG